MKSLCISLLCCRWMLLLTETLCYFDSLLTHYQAKGMSIPGINNPGLSSYIVDRSKHLMRRVSEWAVPTCHVYAWVVLHFSKQLLVLSTDSVSVLRRLCCFSSLHTYALPSVLWRCWLGVRKSIWPVKIEWLGVGVVIWLERGADCLHMVHLMPLHPKTPSSLASFKSRLVLPFWKSPAYPGSGKEVI